MAGTALALIGVSKRYRAGVAGCSASVDALRAVDVCVNAGEIVGLVGPAGAGKSTLLLCAAGLLRPDAGTVTWSGSIARPAASSRMVAFVPEHPVYRCCPSVTVREMLSSYSVIEGASHADEHPTPASVVQTALDDCLHDRVTQLPLYRRRLVALTLALASRPRLLLLDDTLETADSATDPAIGTVLRSLAMEGSAIVVASRYEATLAPVATRYVTLVGGEVHSDQRRNRSAARARCSSRSALARSSRRSTNGRSFRSPQ